MAHWSAEHIERVRNKAVSGDGLGPFWRELVVEALDQLAAARCGQPEQGKRPSKGAVDGALAEWRGRHMPYLAPDTMARVMEAVLSAAYAIDFPQPEQPQPSAPAPSPGEKKGRYGELIEDVRRAAYADSGNEPSRSVLDHALDTLADAITALEAELAEAVGLYTRVNRSLFEAKEELAEERNIVDGLSADITALKAEARRPLFQVGAFKSHAGLILPWKIECDALTDADWNGLAKIAFTVLPKTGRDVRFSDIIGIPRGGEKLARAMRNDRYLNKDCRRLIVDDVLTTGRSMREAMTRPDDIGLVVFARGPLPPRVTALFSMPSGKGK